MPHSREFAGRTLRMPRVGVVSIALTVLAATSALADDGGVENVGGAITLMQGHPHVRMLSEKVVARIGVDSVHVDCLFFLKNEGPADSVLIGFPDQSYSPDGEIPPNNSFRSWVDDREVVCTPVAGEGHGDGSSIYWWTKRVWFPAGATRVVRNRYTAVPSFVVDRSQGFEYILWSGASWKGAIGRAEIVFVLRGIPRSWVTDTPRNALWRGSELRWVFSNLEPRRIDDESGSSPGTVGIRWWNPEHRKEWEHSIGSTP